uniref:Calcium uniporter protein n=1 Tax=Romanomermis culicivorax TaxID=13658 RepID=A0A915KL98_ROMCU
MSDELLASAASMSFKNGSHFLTLKLPTKKDKIHFGINVLHQTVDDLSNDIKREDNSIHEVDFCAPAGSNSTVAESLCSTKIIDSVGKHCFNDNLLTYDADRLKFQLKSLNEKLAPLEQQRLSLVMQAGRRTNNLLWLGLFSMGVQAGFLGRLVWYEYSWDIMEPVTYFVTYTAVIGGFAYFVITRNRYEYDDAKQRIFDDRFYELAKKCKFDVGKYKRLKLEASILESKLNSVTEALSRMNRNTTSESSRFKWHLCLYLSQKRILNLVFIVRKLTNKSVLYIQKDFYVVDTGPELFRFPATHETRRSVVPAKQKKEKVIMDINIVDIILLTIDNDKLISFLKDTGLIKNQRICHADQCGYNMALVKKRQLTDGYVWNCGKCKAQKSIRATP